MASKGLFTWGGKPLSSTPFEGLTEGREMDGGRDGSWSGGRTSVSLFKKSKSEGRFVLTGGILQEENRRK